MFTIGLTELKSAFIFALVTATVAVIIYILSVGDVYKLDHHQLVNIGALSFLNGVLSLLKNFLTTNSGKFMGLVKVK